MEDTLNIKFDGLDELADDLRKVEKAFPNIAFVFIRRAGNAFKREVKNLSDARTTKRKGNLSKGYRSTVEIQRGSMNRYEAQIRGGAGKAQHFHLVENGHAGWVPDRSGRLHYIGNVKGRDMMKDTVKSWQDGTKLAAYAEKARDQALKKGGF